MDLQNSSLGRSSGLATGSYGQISGAEPDQSRCLDRLASLINRNTEAESTQTRIRSALQGQGIEPGAPVVNCDPSGLWSIC